MRRTIFYTQPLLFRRGAFISASGNSTTGNTTGNHIAISSTSLGHQPSGYGNALSHDY